MAVWRTIWQQHEHVVCRIYHSERIVTFEDRQGHWMQGNLAQAQQQVRKVARVQTTMEVQKGKQRHPKRQPVEVEIAASRVRLTYSTGVRRQEPGQTVTKELWLVEVKVLGTTQARLSLAHRLARRGRAERAAHLCDVSRALGSRGQFQSDQRVSGLLKRVQVLDWHALQTLVALAWVAAGFLYQMGVTFQWAEVQLLAKLGGS